MTGHPRHLLLTADPDLPVPPRLYGGIERVIALLANELVARGWRVTLCAHRDSQTAATLVPYAANATASRGTMGTAALIAGEVIRRRPDVVHSFGRLATLAPVLPMPVPKVMSYQREITPRSIRWASRLAHGTITFVACSRAMTEPVKTLANWRVIWNAVDVTRYTPAPRVDADAPLVFLGRIEHIKGAHVAIDVARRTGRRLVLAGNVPDEPVHRAYFDEQIRPYLADGKIDYIGPVDDAQKNELLSHAAALLMPILWEEPFGIVMAEALACGTPVLGFARGAVPEVVVEGHTGFVCRGVDHMVAAVGRLSTLDRIVCRAAAERHFSAKALADAHEQLYTELLTSPRSAASRSREGVAV